MKTETMLTKNTACLIERMAAHAAADQIIQGQGWENGKGCFVGCALHAYNHSRFPLELGWPENLSHLCDAIFESLSPAAAKQFAVDVPCAVGVDGKDLSMVVPQWIYWTLTPESGAKPTAYPQFQPFIDSVIALYEEWSRTGVRPAYRADLTYLAYRADLTDRADLADRAYRADRADLADLADRAYLAYRADLAYLADRAYRADRADLADNSAAKLIELLKAAPVKGAV